MDSPQSVSILGVTGTIGQNSLHVIASNPDRFDVQAVTANTNAQTLAAAAIQSGAKFAAIADSTKYNELKEALAGTSIKAAAGEASIVDAAAMHSDILIAAIVGAAGLKPTLAGVKRGARIALANKECLVCAGDLFMRTAREHDATIIPVDSEHNAIFQLMYASSSRQHALDYRINSTNNALWKDVHSVTLTASGGPFRNFSLEQMASVTPQEAVKHPNWDMGAKISIDSATMINKGLELIEAMHIFNLPPKKLHALVHPQSIIHGMISYHDGSTTAQLSEPDMRVPIAHAMGWPERIRSGIPPINLADIGTLEFHAPDLARFPALNIAIEAMVQGGSAPTVLNAANEIAVEAFLAGSIGFLDIASTIEETLSQTENQPVPTIDEVWHVDRAARQIAKKCIANLLLSNAS